MEKWCCGGEVQDIFASFGFTCPCVGTEWVTHGVLIIHTHTFIRWWTHWQDRTRIIAPPFISKICCASFDFGAHPIIPTIPADLKMPYEKTSSLATKPPKKHISHSNSITGEKYQKLHRHSQWIFLSIGAISTLLDGFATKLDCWF